MTTRSRWWGGNSVGHAVDFSQANALEWAYQMLAGGNVNVGVLSWAGNAYAATGTASPVAVGTGTAVCRGFVVWDDAAQNVTIPTPASATRIDRIVLRASWAAQTVVVARVQGAEGGGAPALTQTLGTTWEIPLWQVSITTGGVITLTDERKFVGMNDDTVTVNPGGRLTLTSGTPVTTADVSGTTLYYTPSVGEHLPVYDTNAKVFRPLKFAETSLALTTTGNTYDIFGYNNAGVLALEQVAWATTTTRSVSLSRVGGLLVKATDFSRLYLGTISVVGGILSDTHLNRGLWNAYNRSLRPIRQVIAGGTNTNTGWAQVLAAAGPTFVVGVIEDAFKMCFQLLARHSLANTPIDLAIDYSTLPRAVSPNTNIGRLFSTSTTISVIGRVEHQYLPGGVGLTQINGQWNFSTAGTFTWEQNPAPGSLDGSSFVGSIFA